MHGQTDILIDYEIFDPSGKVLNSAFHQRLDLKKTLPAFFHGIQGMQLGEKREILIHPSLAYGVHTLLEKGIFLKIIVTLHYIYDSSEQPLPPLEPTNLSYLLEKTFYTKCEEQCKMALKLMGLQKRKFLKTCPGIQMELIKKAFLSPEGSLPLNQDESDAINDLFWKAYFQV